MIRRMPIYAHYVNGLPGGIDNPLGARALYLYRGNQDTDFRLHGTNEPETIGTKVSSGCIRLFNHDIIDLYNRVPVGSPVVVLQEGESMRAEAGPATGGYYDPYGPEPPGPYPGTARSRTLAPTMSSAALWAVVTALVFQPEGRGCRPHGKSAASDASATFAWRAHACLRGGDLLDDRLRFAPPGLKRKVRSWRNW